MAASGEVWSYLLGELDGFPLAYRVCGEGKPLVFLHGFGTTSASWQRCAEMISGPHRKILLDLPGHGHSGRTVPAAGALRYCIEAVVAFLRQPDLRHCVVAAHSFGGYLLLRALLDHHLTPSAVILADIPAFPQNPPKVVNFFASSAGSSLAFAVTPLQLITWIGQREVFYDAHKIPSLLVKEYAGALRAPGTVTSLQRLAKAIQHEVSVAPPLVLDHFTTPTLILWGSHDRLVPVDSGRRLHDALPTSELHILPKTGHAPQEESPQETAAIIEPFLEQVW